MKISVLIDNSTYIDRYLLGEPGLSIFIETGSHKILFDTGYSNAYIGNAKKMNLDLSETTDVVLSHGHIDHTGGLNSLIPLLKAKPRLYACEGAFEEKKISGISSGIPVDKNALEKAFDIRTVVNPISICENIKCLGRIPRVYPEENLSCGFTVRKGVWTDDFCADDTALYLDLNDGIFIITGCSHSGINNIVDYAIKTSGKKRVKGILGGFHLLQLDAKTESVIKRLSGYEIETLYPCHCTSLFVKGKLCDYFNVMEVATGLQIII